MLWNVTLYNGYRILYLRGSKSVVYNNSFTFLNSSARIISPMPRNDSVDCESRGRPH